METASRFGSPNFLPTFPTATTRSDGQELPATHRTVGRQSDGGCRQELKVDSVEAFDGQRLVVSSSGAADGGDAFDLGSYLGGGSSGVVYEATHVSSGEQFAVKIQPPLGYKLLPPAAIARCTVLLKVRACDRYSR